jgi:hypothetical protein
VQFSDLRLCESLNCVRWRYIPADCNRLQHTALIPATYKQSDILYIIANVLLAYHHRAHKHLSTMGLQSTTSPNVLGAPAEYRMQLQAAGS